MDYILSRIHQIRDRLKSNNIDAILVLSSENRRYLSNFKAEDHQCDESAGALIISPDRMLLATDSRFDLQAQKEANQYKIYIYKESLAKSLPHLILQMQIHKLAFESIRLSVRQHLQILEELKVAQIQVDLVPIDGWVEDLRIIKSQKEIEKTNAALSIAEKVFLQVISHIQPGMTEKEICWQIEKGMREYGADSPSFPTIIATGPNSALPHATPSDRVVQLNETIIIDWGARLQGYCSDTTRTLFLGSPDDKFLHVYRTVLEAQQLAIEAIKPGISSKFVDSIARNHISRNGYGEYFGHGLGHGTGLAVHEGPRLSPIKETILREGMIITVEPGVYLPEWGGVRIENQVVVESDGARVLNCLKESYSIEDFQ
jgi:Xaa-Pro aminopeptidase